MADGQPRSDDGPPRGSAAGGTAYAALIETARDFLDRLAGAGMDDATVVALDRDMRAWAARLAALEVDEGGQAFGRRRDLPGRGQVMVPYFLVEARDATSLRASVTFGRYFLGMNGAVHGGAVALLFDEVLGMLGNGEGETISRTAYLHIDYRSITPVGVRLDLAARLVTVDGRKRVVRGEISDAGKLCAEAEGLFVQLRPGQP